MSRTPLPGSPSVLYRRPRYSSAQLTDRARAFRVEMESRRTVRELDDEDVPREVVIEAIRTAATGPSGANRQPWKFALIGHRALKRRIREAVEEEERRNYEGGRMPGEWRKALAPLQTSSKTPFIEAAPWLIVVFEEIHGVDEGGETAKHYYVKQSVGIACGFLLAAIHMAGLAAVPVTPSPLGILGELLERPKNERPYLMYCVGRPAGGALVPNISKKSLEEVLIDPESSSPEA